MATQRNSTILPLEVLEQIVDEDLASLKLLSASRELRHCALRHLFKSIEISNTNNRITQLQDLIVAPNGAASSDFSNIAYYVKDLVIQFSFRQGDFTLYNFFRQPALLDILGTIQQEGRLSSLTFNLLINPQKEYVKPHGWSDLPTKFQDLFASLIRLPSVISLTIDWLDDLPQELVGLPNLENCALTHSRSPPSEAASEVVMKALKTDHMYKFDGAEGHCRNLQKVEVINTSPEDFIQSWKIMRAAGDNLHSLEIVDAFREKREDMMRPRSAMHPGSDAVKDTPTLAVVPNLRQLRYSALDIGHAAPFGTILLRLFSVPARHENLCSFILKLDYGALVRSVRDAIDTVSACLWTRLDELWASGHFHALKAVEIRVKMTHLYPGLVNAPGIKERIEEVFVQSLTRTSQQKTLSVHIRLKTISLSDFY